MEFQKRITFAYSTRNGAEDEYDLDAETILEEITDDLLFHGDIMAALRRLLQSGLTTKDGKRVLSLEEAVESIKRKRLKLEHAVDPNSIFKNIEDKLEEILKAEKSSIEIDIHNAKNIDNKLGRGISTDSLEMALMRLDLMPYDLPSRMSELNNYRFNSDLAENEFIELREHLRKDILDSHLDNFGSFIENSNEDTLNRIKECINTLNTMLEQRGNNQTLNPSFEEFMKCFGDLFPGNPKTLEELIQMLITQMENMSALFDAMTPNERDRFQQLNDGLLNDLDLSWQVSRLNANLQVFQDKNRLLSDYNFQGSSRLSQAGHLIADIAKLKDLEKLLAGARNPGALLEIDFNEVSRLAGTQISNSIETLSKLPLKLQNEGLIERRGDKLSLTPKGLTKIGSKALKDLFVMLEKDRLNSHFLKNFGVGGEKNGSTRNYDFDTPFHINLGETLRNSIKRGVGTPIGINAKDFVVDETDMMSHSSTVVLVDLSLSMPMKDNFLAAKKVTLALYSLISSKFPNDFIKIVGFSEIAREIPPHKLPEITWDFAYGTNMEHAFRLARKILEKKYGNKQIILITDGEPTAHIEDGGEVYFNYPPTSKTVKATLLEVKRLTKANIRINTFMLDDSVHLKEFIERMTRFNKGRAFFTTPENLGKYVLVDFLSRR